MRSIANGSKLFVGAGCYRLCLRKSQKDGASATITLHSVSSDEQSLELSRVTPYSLGRVREGSHPKRSAHGSPAIEPVGPRSSAWPWPVYRLSAAGRGL